MANGVADNNQQIGEHAASIRSLHNRLDDIKETLERQHRDYREEMDRVEARMEDRIRPLERFKTGLTAISLFCASIGGVAVTWLKAKGVI